MSLTKEILYTISNYPGGYKILYNLIYEKGDVKEQSLRNTLSRMKKKGLLSNKKGVWKITQEGKDLLKEKKSALIHFYSKNKPNQCKIPTTIVVFDIPEKKRLYRDWLRSELIGLGFEQIQKSVWLGPKLPKTFVIYLNEHKLLDYIRFFKATEQDII